VKLVAGDVEVREVRALLLDLRVLLGEVLGLALELGQLALQPNLLSLLAVESLARAEQLLLLEQLLAAQGRDEGVHALVLAHELVHEATGVFLHLAGVAACWLRSLADGLVAISH
jgi:hypothetical protein